jgi:hypothetical protein
LSISSRFSNLFEYNKIVVPNDSLDFLVFCYFLFCISDFTNLGLFPPHFSQICQWSVNLVYFFQRTCFLFCWYVDMGFFFFLVSISLILAFIFYYFSSYTCFGFLVCSCFSRSLRCSIRLFIWDLSVFLIYAFMAINFPLRTAFVVYHRF